MELKLMVTARQGLREHIPAAMNTHVTTEELLDTAYVMSNTQYVVKRK
jgi:hypothetical protein